MTSTSGGDRGLRTGAPGARAHAQPPSPGPGGPGIPAHFANVARQLGDTPVTGQGTYLLLGPQSTKSQLFSV